MPRSLRHATALRHQQCEPHAPKHGHAVPRPRASPPAVLAGVAALAPLGSMACRCAAAAAAASAACAAVHLQHHVSRKVLALLCAVPGTSDDTLPTLRHDLRLCALPLCRQQADNSHKALRPSPAPAVANLIEHVMHELHKGDTEKSCRRLPWKGELRHASRAPTERLGSRGAGV